MELQKATQQFLVTQFCTNKHKKVKDGLVPATLDYLESAINYQESLKKM